MLFRPRRLELLLQVVGQVAADGVEDALRELLAPDNARLLLDTPRALAEVEPAFRARLLAGLLLTSKGTIKGHA